MSDEGTVRWECLFAARGSLVGALTPPEIAKAIAAALADQRATGHGDAGTMHPGGAMAWRTEPDEGSLMASTTTTRR